MKCVVKLVVFMNKIYQVVYQNMSACMKTNKISVQQLCCRHVSLYAINCSVFAKFCLQKKKSLLFSVQFLSLIKSWTFLPIHVMLHGAAVLSHLTAYIYHYWTHLDSNMAHYFWSAGESSYTISQSCRGMGFTDVVRAGLTYNLSPCTGIVMGVLVFYFYLLPDYSATQVFFVVCHEASSIRGVPGGMCETLGECSLC